MALVWSGFLKTKVVTALLNHKESKTQYSSCNLPAVFIVKTVSAYTSHQEACGEKWETKKLKELIYEFFKPCIPYKFRIWEYIYNTNSAYLRKLKNKECYAKTRFEFVEMHTNSLDNYLIDIVT